jgi:hypothetical protein
MKDASIDQIQYNDQIGSFLEESKESLPMAVRCYPKSKPFFPLIIFLLNIDY